MIEWINLEKTGILTFDLKQSVGIRTSRSDAFSVWVFIVYPFVPGETEQGEGVFPGWDGNDRGGNGV